MADRSSPRPHFAAAFWLLALAWLCANARPGAVTALFDWFAASAHFSHQQRLSAQIVSLFAGEAGEERESRVAESEPNPRSSPTPPGTPPPTFKKLEAPLARDGRLPPPRRGEVARLSFSPPVPGRDRAAPPHGPPRVSSVV